jgi:hypothetical protein
MSSKFNWCAPILFLYSIAILMIEYCFGHDYVRYYLEDLKGPVLLWGLNTTITTVLLVIISYNFILTYIFARGIKKTDKHFRFYFVFQAALFLYLAIDERFMLHERIGYVLGIHDAFPLLLIGLAELVVLLFFKELHINTLKWNSYLVLGAISFAIMIFIDSYAPSRAVFRISLEDLFKLWGIFFLFCYSCNVYKKWVHPLDSKELK